jgi:hypothetical protein
MSSMLEQAIVDATALKEAAMKNAEATIMEKYSKEIKETVNSMLNESPEDNIEYASMEQPEQHSEDSDASTLVLDLSELEEMARQSVGDDLDMADIMAHEDLAGDVEAAETAPEPTADIGNIDEEIDLENLLEGEEPVEEVEISEEQLKDIVEKLTLDFHPEKTGWLEKPQFETRQAELEAEALAAHDDGSDEEMDKLQEAFKTSEKENENLRGKLEEMTNSIQEMKSFANKVKGTLSEVNLQNARLLYTNKALSSDSLNGRQKEKLVEAISNSKTVEEAKVIYETLQGAVGEQRQQSSAPKSLSEAVTKRSSALLKGSEAKPTRDPNLDRMKRLAGIN